MLTAIRNWVARVSDPEAGLASDIDARLRADRQAKNREIANALLGKGVWIDASDMRPETNIAGRVYRDANGVHHHYTGWPDAPRPVAWFFPDP